MGTIIIVAIAAFTIGLTIGAFFINDKEEK